MGTAGLEGLEHDQNLGENDATGEQLLVVLHVLSLFILLDLEAAVGDHEIDALRVSVLLDLLAQSVEVLKIVHAPWMASNSKIHIALWSSARRTYEKRELRRYQCHRHQRKW